MTPEPLKGGTTIWLSLESLRRIVKALRHHGGVAGEFGIQDEQDACFALATELETRLAAELTAQFERQARRARDDS